MFLAEIFDQDSPADNLKSWFSGSKIVNPDNTPKVMYHGTSADISKFDSEKIGALFGDDKHGFFFTGSPVTAEEYAKHSATKLGGHANIMPVYLSIKNPYTFKDYAYNYYYDVNSPNLADEITDGRLLIDWFDKNKEGLIQIAMEEGRDGIFFVRGSESLAVAFRPNQIKSAIGNKGGYKQDSDELSEKRK